MSSEKAINLLKEHDLKVTDKRLAILETLMDNDQPLNIEDLYLETKKRIDMNLSTAYRTITVLCNTDIVQEITNQDGKSYYQINHHVHEHYLICKDCKKIVPIHDCPFHDFDDKLQGKTGFKILDHKIEYIGICPECQSKDS